MFNQRQVWRQGEKHLGRIKATGRRWTEELRIQTWSFGDAEYSLYDDISYVSLVGRSLKLSYMCLKKKEGDATDKKGLINKLTGIYIYIYLYIYIFIPLR